MRGADQHHAPGDETPGPNRRPSDRSNGSERAGPSAKAAAHGACLAGPDELVALVRRAQGGDVAAFACLVERYEDDKIVVLFDEVGYKTLDLEFVKEYDVLKPA